MLRNGAQEGFEPPTRHYEELGGHRATTCAHDGWRGCKRAGDFMLQSDDTDLEGDASGRGTAEKHLAATILPEMLRLGDRGPES